MIRLYKIGRICAFQPADLGSMFESLCTVTVMVNEPPSPENNWRRRRVPVKHSLWWYDTDPITKEKCFCTYGGYASRIERMLRDTGVDVDVQVRRGHGLPEPDISKVQGTAWRPRQKEVFARLLTSDGGVIVCPTAFGKSFMIRLLARVYPTAVIVITVSSLDVARGLYDELEVHIPDLGFCGTGRQDPRRVTIAVTNSLERCNTDANLVIVDECHTALSPSVMKRLNLFRRAKLFGFTASPEGRSDGGDGFMEAIFGPVLVDVTYQEGVSAGNIVQLRVKMYKSSRGPDVSGITNKVYVDRKGIICNKHRNDLVIRAVKELEQELGESAQILVMVDKVEHAYILARELPGYAVVTGVVPKERRDALVAEGLMSEDTKTCTDADRERYRKLFESNQLKRAIATRVWEKGVDFRDLTGLVRADGLASPIAACQIPGRLSRLGKTVDKDIGVLVDFMDTFSNNLRSRSRARVRSYMNAGWKIENHD